MLKMLTVEVVKKSVKAVLHENGLGYMKVSANFYERLNFHATRLVTQASDRALGNGRKTIAAKDL